MPSETPPTLNRRALLATSGSLLAVAGCVDAPAGGPTTAMVDAPTTTAEAPDWQQNGTVRAGGDPLAYTASMWDGLDPDWAAYPPDEPPTLTVEPSATRVTVRGVLTYGSGNCDRPVVDGVEYLSDATLRVGIATGVRETTPETCTDDLNAASYRVTVDLGTTPADRVVAIETDALGETRRATASGNGDG